MNSVSNTSMTRNQLSESEKRWFAVNTKYKCEKFVAERLSKKGISVYLPLIERTKRYKSGKKTHNVPLINNYVFVEIVKSEYVPVLETEYVIRFLKQGQELISIPKEEIEVLKRVIGEITDVNIGNLNYEVGDFVEVISGQLTGLKGLLIKAEGKRKFIVQLTTIGVQLNMTIDKNNLQLLKKGVTSI